MPAFRLTGWQVFSGWRKKRSDRRFPELDVQRALGAVAGETSDHVQVTRRRGERNQPSTRVAMAAFGTTRATADSRLWMLSKLASAGRRCGPNWVRDPLRKTAPMDFNENGRCTISFVVQRRSGTQLGASDGRLLVTALRQDNMRITLTLGQVEQSSELQSTGVAAAMQRSGSGAAHRHQITVGACFSSADRLHSLCKPGLHGCPRRHPWPWMAGQARPWRGPGQVISDGGKEYHATRSSRS